MREKFSKFEGRITGALLRILSYLVLAAENDKAVKTLEIVRDLQIANATVYKTLGRLYKLGWINAEYESKPISDAGAPSRIFNLTDEALPNARDLIKSNMASPDWFKATNNSTDNAPSAGGNETKKIESA